MHWLQFFEDLNKAHAHDLDDCNWNPFRNGLNVSCGLEGAIFDNDDHCPQKKHMELYVEMNKSG